MSHDAVRIALLIVLSRCPCALGAFEYVATGPRSLSLGNATVAASPDMWALLTNPGGLAVWRSPDAGFFHAPGLFGLPELQFSGGGLSFPVAGMGVAVSATQFGYELYKETVLSLAVGREISGGFGLGLAFHLSRLAIDGYGSSTTLALDVGIRIDCSEVLAIGAVLTNITASTLGAPDEPLPQELSGGIWYVPVSHLRFGFAAAKEMLSALELRCGVECDILEVLTLRAGIIDRPSVVSGGCGFRFAGVCVDYAFSYHWILGVTHEIGIAIRFL